MKPTVRYLYTVVTALLMFWASLSWAEGLQGLDPSKLGQLSNPGTINPNVQITPSQTIPTIDQGKLNLALGARFYGQQGPSFPACGGLVNGQPGPACPPIAATFQGDAVGDCPAGSFPDIALGGCYTCPAGFTRTSEAVDTARACAKADSSVKSSFVPARRGGAACPNGFIDPIRGGECWSCPEGYQRSAAHIEAANACFIPTHDNFAKANMVRKTAWPHDCAKGSFHDAIGGGCFQCPPGFKRSGYSINDARACSMQIQEKVSRATLHGVSTCPAGEFFDPRAGGECWSCPPPTTRTVFPVNESKACENWAGYTYAKATLVSKWSCGAEGGFLDLISSNDPRVRERIRKQYGSNPIPVGIGQGKGGTCWSCPTGRVRTPAAVYSDEACSGPSVVWQPGAWKMPGLFGMDGGEAVVRALLQDRKLIEQVAVSQAELEQKSESVAIRDAWAEIADDPAGSSVLSMAVYSRLIAAAGNPQQASRDELQLLASFAEVSRAFKEYQAQAALDAYESWNALGNYRRNQAAQENALKGMWGEQGLSDVPDFEAIAAETVATSIGAGIGGVAVTAAWRLTMTVPKVKAAIFPTVRSRNALIRMGQKATTEATKKLGPKVASKLSSKLVGKIASKVASAALKEGPQIIIGIAVDMAIEGAVRVEKIQNARQLLLAQLAQSRQPLDIGRMLLTDEGTSSVSEMWIHVLAGETLPQQASTLVALAQAAKQSLGQGGADAPATAKTWQQMPGAATEIGMGGGSLWVVGSKAVQGGREVLRWSGQGWVDMKGGAEGIDVDPNGLAWVVTGVGEIYRHNGIAWEQVPGQARDVGIGANGAVWVIGAQAVQGGYQILKWNNGNWQLVPGGGTRIDVDAQGNPWVISSGGDVFRYGGAGWIPTPGVKANDIGIGADGSVFIAAKDGSIHRWSGQGWERRDGKLAVLTVDAQGIPFGISQNQQIWMGYP